MPTPKLKPVAEQVIVITGATSGIGLATARMAAEKGAAVVLAARNEDALRQLAEEIRGAGGRAEPVVADVADMAQVEAIGEAAIRAFGGFDSWVNNAAAALYGELEDTPLEDQRRQFDVNYWGVVHGTLVAVKHLKGRGGAIINLGSVLSDRAMTFQGSYSASKAAIKGVTDAFRTEFEAEGYPVSVTLIKPGPIDTPYPEHARNLLGSPGLKNPPPLYHPRVVARAILHACEARSRTLTVGGGGWMISMLGAHAPRLTDLLMERTARSAQTTEETGRMERRDNLYEPKEDMAETSSLSGPPPRKTSFLLEAQMNPLGPAGLLIGAVALLGGAALGMYTLRRSRPETLSDRAWRMGRHAVHEAEHGIGTLSHRAGRLARRAIGYVEGAEHDARPYFKQARKGAERFADRAGRYAASAYDDARDRGSDLYDEARGRGRALYKTVRGRGEDAYDDARDTGWSLFKRGRDRAEDTYEDARDRGWSLFGRARDRGEDLYDTARKRGRDAYEDTRDRGWSLFGRARDRGEDLYDTARKRGRDTYEDARDEGWHLFGRARKEADRQRRHAVHEGEGLLDRINAFLKSRL